MVGREGGVEGDEGRMLSARLAVTALPLLASQLAAAISGLSPLSIIRLYGSDSRRAAGRRRARSLR